MIIQTKLKVTTIFSKEETEEMKKILKKHKDINLKHISSELPTEETTGHYIYQKTFDHFHTEMLNDSCTSRQTLKKGYCVFLKKTANAKMQQVSLMYGSEIEAQQFVDEYDLIKGQVLFILKKIVARRDHYQSKKK